MLCICDFLDYPPLLFFSEEGEEGSSSVERKGKAMLVPQGRYPALVGVRLVGNPATCLPTCSTYLTYYL